MGVRRCRAPRHGHRPGSRVAHGAGAGGPQPRGHGHRGGQRGLRTAVQVSGEGAGVGSREDQRQWWSHRPYASAGRIRCPHHDPPLA